MRFCDVLVGMPVMLRRPARKTVTGGAPVRALAIEYASGDRYGRVVGVGTTYAHVRLDRSRRVVKIAPEDLAGPDD